MLGGNLVTRSLVGNRVVGGTWSLGSGFTWTLPAFTAGGDITIGANKILSTNMLIKEGDTFTWYIRNAADDTFVHVHMNRCYLESELLLKNGSAIWISDYDGTYITGEARKNGVGRVEVWRMQGAANPYFGIGSTSGHVAIRTVEVTKAHGSDLFDAAGLTDSATIWQQPAGSVLLGVKIKMTAQFVAASLTDLDVTIGLAGDPDGLLAPTMNLTSDAANSTYTTRGAYWDTSAEGAFFYEHAATDWIAYATATGANLSTTSAGSITFYFTFLDIPSM